jgi:hypothetical protein
MFVRLGGCVVTGEGRRYLSGRGIEMVSMRDAAHQAPTEQREGQRVVAPSDPVPAQL